MTTGAAGGGGLRPAIQTGALPIELPRLVIWRPVRESNPRLPARQAGTLATELTKHVGGSGGVRTRNLPLARRLLSQLSYTPKGFHPVTGSGAAQSLRPISTLEA